MDKIVKFEIKNKAENIPDLKIFRYHQEGKFDATVYAKSSQECAKIIKEIVDLHKLKREFDHIQECVDDIKEIEKHIKEIVPISSGCAGFKLLKDENM